MPVSIDSIGHCAIAASDIDGLASFYRDVLGFEVLERDPEHGGVFLNLAGTSHTIDLFPMGMLGTTPAIEGSPLVHIAFKVSSYAALREAHSTLTEHGVNVDAMLDHTNQRSIYFSDPEHNRLEIYFERPDWKEIFERGRGDDDHPFTFDQEAEEWD
jgi:catechol-2,3-dioxygenase